LGVVAAAHRLRQKIREPQLAKQSARLVSWLIRRARGLRPPGVLSGHRSGFELRVSVNALSLAPLVCLGELLAVTHSAAILC
jgi:hypothetical protein